MMATAQEKKLEKILRNVLDKDEETFELEEEQLPFLFRAVHSLAPRWHGFLLQLSVTGLDQIERNGTSVDDRLVLGLQSWLKGGEGSWRQLIRAIFQPAGGNNPRLAKDIARDFRDMCEFCPIRAAETASCEETLKILDSGNIDMAVRDIQDILAGKVAARWYQMGVTLGAPVSELEMIRVSQRHAIESERMMLKEWLEKGDNTTWQWLVDSVGHVAGGNHLKLAKHMAKKKSGQPMDNVSSTSSPASSPPSVNDGPLHSGPNLATTPTRTIEIDQPRDTLFNTSVPAASDIVDPMHSATNSTITSGRTGEIGKDRILAEKILQVTNEEQHIVWEEYGLRLHIPSNSLPEDCSQLELKIAVIQSGQYKLVSTEEGMPVSAVYLFNHDLGDKELRQSVTLEMQHCAKQSAFSHLRIVRADEKSDVPYEFQVIPGGLFGDGGYAMIKLRQLCSFRVYMLWFSISIFSKYEMCAKLYYININHHSFEFCLYIVPNLNALFKEITDDIRTEYGSYVPGPMLPLHFIESASKISLDLSERAPRGWKITEMNSHEKNIESVVSLQYDRRLIPFRVSVRWNEDESAKPTMLEYHVKIIGIEKNSITIKPPTGCTDHSKPAEKIKPTRSLDMCEFCPIRAAETASCEETLKIYIDKDILQVKEILRSLEKQDLKNLFRELGLYDHTVRNKDSESLEVYAEDLVRAWILGKDNVVNSYQGGATWENLKKALVKINYVGVARSI